MPPYNRLRVLDEGYESDYSRRKFYPILCRKSPVKGDSKERVNYVSMCVCEFKATDSSHVCHEADHQTYYIRCCLVLWNSLVEPIVLQFSHRLGVTRACFLPSSGVIGGWRSKKGGVRAINPLSTIISVLPKRNTKFFLSQI